MVIQNPILPGFNPDPSLIRVEDDYYLANSTFEWFPGIQIHHSQDLMHWRLLDHGLKSQRQLDLRGVSDSGGIWAPSLSWDKGVFYLVYTIVRYWGGGRPFKDVYNYLITAESIHGPWSQPVFLNSSGFDASLFHDENGRKWVVNIQWDFRKGQSRFGGILLQEYDPLRREMIGPVRNILKKKALIEGPNLYQRNGFYYLMLAEGGTGWEHAISMARARQIKGPYELDPLPLILTSRHDPQLELQKAGHGEIVETSGGEWYLAHLCGRPVMPERRCILGRETALQKVHWSEDGWLRLDSPGTNPQVTIPAPQGVTPHPWPALPARDEFTDKDLAKTWSSLRIGMEEPWVSLTARPGWLRLIGRESLHSLNEQNLLMQRVASLHLQAETCLDFQPTDFTQMAGLIFYYDTRTHYYLRVTHLEDTGKVLSIVLTDDNAYDELIESQIIINDWPLVYLRATLKERELQFRASPDGQAWQKIGPVLDATKVSDDYGTALHFTGAMIGICCQDLNSKKAEAYFDYFELKPALAL